MLTTKFTSAGKLLVHFAFGALISLPLTSFAVDSTSTAGKSNEKGHMHHHDMKMTGDADYDFAMMMKKHHEKGVKMAQDELEKGKDTEMRAAAQKIIETQNKEIADFDEWLMEHPMKTK